MYSYIYACIDTYVHTYKHTHIHTYIVTTDRPPATNAITDTTPFRRCAATGDRHTRHKSTHNTHRFADALRQGIVTHEHAQVRGFEGEASLPVACCCVRPSSQQLLQRPVARLCACMSCRRVCVCVLYIHTHIYIYIYTYIHTYIRAYIHTYKSYCRVRPSSLQLLQRPVARLRKKRLALSLRSITCMIYKYAHILSVYIFIHIHDI